ncbi:MAG: sigma-70 family RNA polymerase sigma factor [Myxococcota bacterium]
MSTEVPGDDAWAALVRGLRGFLRARGVPEADADDVLQTALVRIVEGLGRLRDPNALDAFAFRTLRNALADHYRRGPKDLPGPLEAPEPAAEVREPEDERLVQRVLAAWLRQQINELPEPTRTTLRRTELEGWTHRRVAEAEGVSVSAIKSRVSRGRAELHRRLRRCCEVELDARNRVVALAPRDCDC